MEMSNFEILKYASENGMIDFDTIQKQIEDMEKDKYLKMHPFSIWEGKTDKLWHTYLPDEEGGRIPKKRKTEDEIKKLVIDFWKEKSENPTIEEVFEEWNDRRLELKKISNSTHLRNQQIFKRHYSEFGKKRIKSVTPDEIGEFLEEQIPKYDLTAKAFSNLKGITRGLLKRAKKRKLFNYNVEEFLAELDTSETDFKKVIKEDYEEVFSEDEMPIIMDYLINNLDKKNIGILLMFVTGIRVGELVALKNEVFESNSFKIRRTETKYLDANDKYVYGIKEFPKSDAGVRTVIIPNDYLWLCEMIRSLNPYGEYIFLNNKGERMTTNSIRSRLRIICRKLGIYRKPPHKIRKTYGSILLDNNVDSRLIIGQMGHSDILCTENHYHRNRKSIDRKSEIISAIPEFLIK